MSISGRWLAGWGEWMFIVVTRGVLVVRIT